MPGKTLQVPAEDKGTRITPQQELDRYGSPGTWQEASGLYNSSPESCMQRAADGPQRGGENRDLLCLTYLGTSKLSPLAAAPILHPHKRYREFQFLHILTSPFFFFFFFFFPNYSHPQWESNSISQLSLDHMLHDPYSAGTQITDGHKGLNDTSSH